MMKEYYYIYEITNNVNGKRYRGKHFTRDLDDGYMVSGIAIKSAYRKYGKENFTKDILMFCKDIDDLNYWESLMVDKYWVDREDTYNMVIGGVGVNGLKLTEETKRKLSETRKARLASGAEE